MESDHSEASDHMASSSDAESSTDIDAVVKEYKDRITVTLLLTVMILHYLFYELRSVHIYRQTRYRHEKNGGTSTADYN